MKIHCSKEELAQSVQTIQSALSARTTLPILLNFLLETENSKVKVVSTDLEMGVKHFCIGWDVRILADWWDAKGAEMRGMVESKAKPAAAKPAKVAGNYA